MPCSEPVAGCHAECRLDCHSTRGTQTQQRRRAPPTRGGVNKSAGFILLSCVALLLLCGCCFSSALDANSGNEQSTKAWTPPTGDGERDDQGGTEESESELEQAARESYEKGSGEDWWGDDRTPGTSVEKLHVLLDILAPVYNPVKLMFGLGLLLHGRALSHVILFTHAFKISGWPVLKRALSKVKATRAAYMREREREPSYTSTMPLQALAATLQPEEVMELIAGLHYGLVTCIAAVVSPAVGAAGVGLSVGQSVDRHVQPLIRRYVATDKRLLTLKSPHLRHWLNSLANHASEMAGVVAALSFLNFRLLSGCLLGAQLVVDVSMQGLQQHLRRLARRSDHTLLHRAARNFDPARAASGAWTYLTALAGFASQLRYTRGLSVLGRTLLCVPLLLETVLQSAKWTLLAGSSATP